MSKNILLGLTNCVDFEVDWSATTINELISLYNIRTSEIKEIQCINSERDLLITILSYFIAGIGKERFVSSCETISAFAKHLQFKPSLGGTSFRASKILDKLGVSSSLHLVTMNEYVSKGLPKLSRPFGNFRDYIVRPHLIIQFSKGDHFLLEEKLFYTPQSNRLIFVNDINSREVTISPEWRKMAETADVILVSGFNSIQDESLLEKRLNEMADSLKNRKKDSLVIVEDAGYHNPNLHQKAIDSLSCNADIFSMNEDELEFHIGEKVNLLSSSHVYKSLLTIKKILLSKMVIIHTRFWTCIIGDNAINYKNSIIEGNAVATTCYRKGYSFSIEDLLQTKQIKFSEESYRFCKELSLINDKSLFCYPTYKIKEERVYPVGLGDAFIGGFISKL